LTVLPKVFGLLIPLVTCRAPEQLYRSFGDDSIKPPLTAAADIWAWACSVIHMATGSAPELELDIMAAFRGYLGKKAPAIPAHLPHYLRDILSKCLVVDPLKRPSALEVLKTWQVGAGRARH
jgi:serine/threonine protein kinase